MANSNSLDSRWIRHLRDPQDQKDFEEIVRHSTRLLTRLKEILTERERDVNEKAFSEKDFEDSNWSHKAAARIGRLAELKSLKELIPF